MQESPDWRTEGYSSLEEIKRAFKTARTWEDTYLQECLFHRFVNVDLMNVCCCDGDGPDGEILRCFLAPGVCRRLAGEIHAAARRSHMQSHADRIPYSRTSVDCPHRVQVSNFMNVSRVPIRTGFGSSAASMNSSAIFSMECQYLLEPHPEYMIACMAFVRGGDYQSNWSWFLRCICYSFPVITSNPSFRVNVLEPDMPTVGPFNVLSLSD